jgi:hypothetical protein
VRCLSVLIEQASERRAVATKRKPRGRRRLSLLPLPSKPQRPLGTAVRSPSAPPTIPPQLFPLRTTVPTTPTRGDVSTSFAVTTRRAEAGGGVFGQSKVVLNTLHDPLSSRLPSPSFFPLPSPSSSLSPSSSPPLFVCRVTT